MNSVENPTIGLHDDEDHNLTPLHDKMDNIAIKDSNGFNFNLSVVSNPDDDQILQSPALVSNEVDAESKFTLTCDDVHSNCKLSDRPQSK